MKIINSYVSLFKLRILFLVVLTGATCVFISPDIKQHICTSSDVDAQMDHLQEIEKYRDDQNLTVGTLFLGALILSLISAGCNVLNMAYDRDIDKVMTRTKNRAIPSGSVSFKSAYALGYILSATALILSYIYKDLICMILVAFSIAIYFPLYTVFLKRSKTYFFCAVLIGGISAAMTPIITSYFLISNLTYESIALFLMLFFWSPAHSYALNIYLANDYKSANLSTIYSEYGHQKTLNLILIFSILTFLSSLLLVNNMSSFLCLMLPNLYFLYRAWELKKNRISAFSFFKTSVQYLFIVYLFLILLSVY